MQSLNEERIRELHALTDVITRRTGLTPWEVMNWLACNERAGYTFTRERLVMRPGHVHVKGDAWLKIHDYTKARPRSR